MGATLKDFEGIPFHDGFLAVEEPGSYSALVYADKHEAISCEYFGVLTFEDRHGVTLFSDDNKAIQDTNNHDTDIFAEMYTTIVND